ncbi:MAG: ABC transporter permease, partial [Saprospiraceae bacterium]|nr:ABC transporter permease [Saprospiraceae bacterium]
MIRNYFKVAWRTLLKNRWHSIINIVGLATSISVCVVLFLLYQYESGFDKFRPNYDRIYRVYSQFSGVFEGVNRGVPGPAAAKLKGEFTGIESATAFFNLTSDVKVKDESATPKVFKNQGDVIFTDADYFKTIGGYTWISNNQEAFLSEPFQVILSEAKAKKYFSVEDPLDAIDRVLIYRDSIEVTVSGIVSLPDENTDFIFQDFISLSTATDSRLKNQIDLEGWANTNSSSQLFIKLLPGVEAVQIESQFGPLDELYRASSPDEDWKHKYRLQPLSELHYNANLGIFDSTRWSPASRKTLSIFLLVSVLLIIIAAINFVNLETAKATLRAQDIGIRKTLGSTRISLIFQYMGETALLTLFAILLSLTLADLGARYFDDFFPMGFSVELISWQNLIFLSVLWVLITILASLYPATIISKFKTTDALYGRVSHVLGKTNIRQGLIVFQFCVAQFFIISTLIVGKQIKYMLEKDLGFNTDAIVVLNLP